MLRGEVWWVNSDPVLGGEIQKVRPAVIISNDSSNRYLNRVQVIPITSSIDRLYPGEAFVTINGERRKALANQITTASKLRLKNRLTVLSSEDTAAIEEAIRVQLDLA